MSEKIIFVCLYLHEFMCITWMQEPMEAKRGHRVHWYQGYRWLCGTGWVLGTESSSSGRTVTTPTAEPPLPPGKLYLKDKSFLINAENRLLGLWLPLMDRFALVSVFISLSLCASGEAHSFPSVFRCPLSHQMETLVGKAVSSAPSSESVSVLCVLAIHKRPSNSFCTPDKERRESSILFSSVLC